MLNQLVNQRNDLKDKYSRSSIFKRSIEASSDGSFEKSWAPMEGLETLRDFCAGLASIMAGSHTVEGDFSILKRTKDSTRCQMSNYAMEGQMQARQYTQIAEICRDMK